MASIIDAVRNIIEDTWWFPKFVLISCLTYFPVFAKLSGGYDDEKIQILGLIIFCIFLGIGSFHIKSVINNERHSLPGLFDLISVIRNSLVAPILFIPGLAFGIVIYLLIQIYFPDQEPMFYYITGIILFLLFISFSMIPVILYSVKYRILDAFNFPIIFKSAGNYIVETLSFVIQYAFTVFIFWVLIYYLLINMFEMTIILQSVLYALFATSTIIIFFAYSALIYGSGIMETIATEDTGRTAKDKTRRRKSRRNAS